MSSNGLGEKNHDWGGLCVATFFILMACLTLYDTTHYSDFDSKVFPRACAIVLLVLAVASVVQIFLSDTDSDGFGNGSWWRRLLLLGTMLIACALMPRLGFLPAGGVAFAGGLIAAMHDRWNLKSIFVYWGAGVLTTVAFYIVFRYALHVPLP